MTAVKGQRNGESSQLWNWLDRFTAGEVVIADRAYGSYFMLSALQQRGIDFVIRKHGAQKRVRLQQSAGEQRPPVGLVPASSTESDVAGDLGCDPRSHVCA